VGEYALRQPAARIGVIGYGAITDEIVRCLELRGQLHTLAGVLGRPEKISALADRAAGRFPVFAELKQLLARKPDIVIEAAGHGAMHAFAADVLNTGCDLLIASTGALADAKLADTLVASLANGAEVWLASGAVAGIDGLLAARTAGLRSVTYTSLKGPAAWQGTPARALLGAAARTQRVIFFSGSAREAALHYPQNANVGATIALAGIGLDRTRVELGADPHVPGPLGIIEAEGEFGSFKFDILALASARNPKTSALTGHSLVAAALDGMCFRGGDALRAEMEERQVR
jgi:aspartate dehydrogenase